MQADNFWHTINKPITCLAPMEDVTDTAFREVLLKISDSGCPKVLFTEFTSTDGLMHEKGYQNVVKRLKVNENERELLKNHGVKIVAQIWGANPDKYYTTARLLGELFDFDGIDINMGCPVKKIIKHGSCSALINKPDLAGEIIEATRAGCSVPLSVKTRIGFHRTDTENWIGFLLKYNLDALIIHGRTQKMQSEGKASWEEIKKAVAMRNAVSPNTTIIGNGDVMSMSDGMRKTEMAGCEGFMVGRGIFHDPWLFRKEKYSPGPEEKIETLQEHIRCFYNNWDGERNFAIMKRFFKIYINDFHGAHELRVKLMETDTAEEAKKVLDEYRF